MCTLHAIFSTELVALNATFGSSASMNCALGITVMLLALNSRGTDFERVLHLADEIDRAVTGAGYRYVSLDLRGFRSGSLNESLDQLVHIDISLK